MSTTTTPVDIGTMIWRMPCETGHRPCIAGTGTSVKCIAGWYKMGLSAEEILVKYTHLSLAQIYAALAYYHANRTEIEAAMATDAQADREGAAAARGLVVRTVNEENMGGKADEEQLIYATSNGMAIFTYNIPDFCRIH